MVTLGTFKAQFNHFLPNVRTNCMCFNSSLLISEYTLFSIFYVNTMGKTKTFKSDTLACIISSFTTPHIIKFNDKKVSVTQNAYKMY